MLLICAHLITTAILEQVILYDCGVTKIGEVKVPVQLAPRINILVVLSIYSTTQYYSDTTLFHVATLGNWIKAIKKKSINLGLSRDGRVLTVVGVKNTVDGGSSE